jgi:hypothetical protein
MATGITHSFITTEPTWAGISNTVPRFHPRFWDVNFNAKMFGTVISGTDSLTINMINRCNGDFLQLLWRSTPIFTDAYGDKAYQHPKYQYQANKDFTNCTLSFHIKAYDCYIIGTPGAGTDVNQMSFMFYKTNGYTQKSYLCSHASNRTITTVGGVQVEEADISLTFNSSLLDIMNSPYTTPVDITDIDLMAINLLYKDYTYGGTTNRSDLDYKVEITGITVSGSNTTMKRPNDFMTAHSVKMADGYDDSYNMTPENVVESIYELGYRDWYNLYIGMAHFYNLKWDSGLSKFQVDLSKTNSLNLPTRVWITDLWARLHAKGFNFVGSVSMELLNHVGSANNWEVVCPSGWEQKTWGGDIAQTGWSPKALS